MQLLLANGGQTIGSVTVAPGEENVPLTYSLPDGRDLRGLVAPKAARSWPADKTAVSYDELMKRSSASGRAGRKTVSPTA